MKKLSVLFLLASINVSASAVDSDNMMRKNPDVLKAVQLAETYSGGYAFKVEREDVYGNQYYSVEISNQAGEPSTLWIDMNQGQVINVTPSFATPDMVGKNSYWFSAIKNDSSISISRAIQNAEKMTGYSALRADYELGDVYEIDLINNSGHELEIRISAENDYDHD